METEKEADCRPQLEHRQCPCTCRDGDRTEMETETDRDGERSRLSSSAGTQTVSYSKHSKHSASTRAAGEVTGESWRRRIQFL